MLLALSHPRDFGRIPTPLQPAHHGATGHPWRQSREPVTGSAGRRGAAIYDGPLLDDLPDSDIAAYLATMRRFRELPVSVVHGGHEPSFGRGRMIEIADAYLARRERGR